jgi:hypothetical protein
MRETNAAVLLRRKTNRLIKETGNTKLVSKFGKSERPRQVFLKAIVRPTKMIVFSPIVLLLSLYSGTLYGVIFLLFTTFPTVFQETYGFGTGISGLAYLGLGLGFMCGLLVFSLLSDKLLGQKRDAAVAQPEKRLILMKWFAPITPLGCFGKRSRSSPSPQKTFFKISKLLMPARVRLTDGVLVSVRMDGTIPCALDRANYRHIHHRLRNPLRFHSSPILPCRRFWRRSLGFSTRR